jgi:propionyl-CoA carboxylase beta chain
MGADGAVDILYSKQLKEAEDPESARVKLITEYQDQFSTPYRAAASGHVDEIIIPSETRPRLIAALELLKNKQGESRPKKHGNMPV